MRLDIVIPAHNEEARIGRTLAAYARACPDARTRFVIALDSCSDRTADVVRRHRARDRRIELMEFPRLGKGGVIAAAFGRSAADLVGFVDADGATPPDEMLRLADTARRTDGAIACRRHPAAVLPARRPLVRRITSAGFSLAVRRVMRLPFADTQCGAKVLRREVVEDVLPRLSSRDLLFDVDLLAAAGERGWRIVEVPTVWIDQEGSRVRPVSDTRRMGVSLLRLWARRRRVAAAPAARTPSRATPLDLDHGTEAERVLA